MWQFLHPTSTFTSAYKIRKGKILEDLQQLRNIKVYNNIKKRAPDVNFIEPNMLDSSIRMYCDLVVSKPDFL